MALADRYAAPREDRFSEWLDRHSGRVMLLPAVILLLCFAIFPLIVSAYMALSRFALKPGGFELKFVGLRNIEKLLFGSQQYHFLGTFGVLTVIEWILFGLFALAILYGMARYFRSGRATIVGTIGRLITIALAGGAVFLFLLTVGQEGYPGTLITTLLYVFVGVSVQFLLGLGLALLCSQQIRGRNFFRVTFFIPLMVTPVGIAYTFRMLADLEKGPLSPFTRIFGFASANWAGDPWAARMVVLLGDTWQWTPFMFIVLLAAIEAQPRDQVEAARIDGASGRQIFRDITWPAIAPVAATVVLIRLIEAFKIVDLPNVLTNGGPGIATESLTLHSFIVWRAQNLGESASVGYMLLFVSTITCVSFFHYVARRARKHEA